MRLPLKQRTSTVGSRHDLCGGRCPPAGERDLDAGDPLQGLDHFEQADGLPTIEGILLKGDSSRWTAFERLRRNFRSGWRLITLSCGVDMRAIKKKPVIKLPAAEHRIFPTCYSLAVTTSGLDI
jgi:hypothetical protein